MKHSQSSKKVLSLLSIFALGVGLTLSSCSTTPTSGANADGSFTLSIAHVNDSHSQLEGFSGAQFKIAGKPTQVNLGGSARAVTIFKSLEKSQGNLLKLHAGDAVTGTLYYTFYKGKADAEQLNNICFDAFVLGNHEFDDGDKVLAQFLNYLGTGNCKTPVISANVDAAADTPIAGMYKPYIIKDMGGVKVGIIGITIAGKTLNSSSPLPTTKIYDEITTAQKTINELIAQGVNKIIVMSHQGYDNDVKMAKAISGVDIIIGGDSHSLLGDFSALEVKSEGAYPTLVKNKDGDIVCVAQAWEYFKVVGNLQVNFDKDGRVGKCSGSPLLVLGEEFKRENADKKWVKVSDDDQAEILKALSAVPNVQVVKGDEKAVTELAVYTKQVDEQKKKIIGEVTAPLCLVREPGESTNRSTSTVGCENANTLARGSTVAQSVAEAFLSASKRADFSLQNAGGVRIPIPTGQINMNTAFNLLPYDNVLVELDITGEEIKASLEDAVSNFIDKGQSNGSHPYAANLRWDLDMSKPFGSRFNNIEIKPRNANWQAIDLKRKYIMVTNDYIAGGKDGYLTLGKVTKDGRSVNTYLLYTQSYVDYVEKIKKIGPPKDNEFSHKSVVTKAGVRLAN